MQLLNASSSSVFRLSWILNVKLTSVQIPPDDIRWEGEDPFRSGHGDFVSDVPRMRVSTKDQPRRQFPSAQNGFPSRFSDDIELLNTETLVKEVSFNFLIDMIYLSMYDSFNLFTLYYTCFLDDSS